MRKPNINKLDPNEYMNKFVQYAQEKNLDADEEITKIINGLNRDFSEKRYLFQLYTYYKSTLNGGKK